MDLGGNWMRGRVLRSCGSGWGKMTGFHENYDEPWCSIILRDLVRHFTSTSSSE